MSRKVRSTFIAEARREQLVDAAIQTLDEIGYAKASLAQIARSAGISTALISYHFADKSDFMNHVLMKLVEKSETYILEQVSRAQTASAKLEAFIIASLAYHASHPAHNNALLEIIFHARTPDNIPYYKLGSDDDEEDAALRELRQILRKGQESGEFGSFHVEVMANMIQGAISENMMLNTASSKIDLETISKELVNIVRKATARMGETG